MTNTEKPTTKAEQMKQAPVATPIVKKQEIKNMPNPVKPETKQEIVKDIEKSGVSEKVAATEEALDEKAQQVKPEDKKDVPKKTTGTKKSGVKKTTTHVKGTSLPISTKYAVFLCKFIKHKGIEKAIADLEQVLVFKKSVPMKGEIPHRKGPGMSSGRFPKKATEYFIMLLKSLLANANANDIDEPIIKEAMANMASRPLGRFGSIKRKRTHVQISVVEKKTQKKSKKKVNKKVKKK